MRDFNTRTFGKWILAGEHAVLRGCPALAFPLLTRSLNLEYKASDQPLTVEFAGEHGNEMNLLFYGVYENAMSRLKIAEPQRGKFIVTNGLRVGAGLGASAALCGAIARWCEAQGWVPEEEVYEFARKLEDLFHGESSGVDLAVSLSAQGIRFVRGGERTPFKPKWWPKLYISYSGQRGMTSECVSKVKRLFDADILRAQSIDQRMRESVELAERALTSDSPEAPEQLRTSLELASSCFEDWGLIFGDLGTHMSMLREKGAYAVKPTGSGGGGFVLSFWLEEPPEDLKRDLLLLPEPQSRVW